MRAMTFLTVEVQLREQAPFEHLSPICHVQEMSGGGSLVSGLHELEEMHSNGLATALVSTADALFGTI